MFDLIRKTPLEEYNGEGLFYVHRETGMEIFHIKNKDSERTCCFTFSTPSEDNTGVAHILEHTVLCGSKRFPVKDPFNQVVQSSPNTYLNAMTFPDKTMYPFSSPIKKDFDIIFDLYSDAVFAPLLRKNSFLQEGIRLFDGKPDGVVYNEMSGTRNNEDSLLQQAINQVLFEATPGQYDAGGDPQEIITLSYEEYLDRYKKWYSPSNCRMFLFGDLDTKEYLDKLEEKYLKNATKGEKIIPRPENYLKEQLKTTRKVVGCPSMEASSVVLSWLTNPCDSNEVLLLSFLVDVLLGNTAAPLYRAIAESDLGEDLNSMSGMNPDSPILTFTVGFVGAKPGKEKEIEAFLLNTLSKFVKEGIPKDNVAAVLKRMEFKLQEIPEGSIPYGLSTCIKADRYWHRGLKPEDGIRDAKRLEKLKENLESGHYLEDWIQKNLLDNPKRALISVVYDPNFYEDARAKEELNLSKMPRQGKKEKEDFEAFVNTPDTPEALATIGHITLEDVPPSIPAARHEVHHTKKGAKVYVLPLFTRSIVYLRMYFDARDLNEEEHKLLPILTRLLNMCGTSEYEYSEFENQTRLYTGSFVINPLNGRNAMTYKPQSGVFLSTRFLRRDMPKVLALIEQILFKAELSDPVRVKAVLTDILSDYKNGFSYSANSFAALSAASEISAVDWESECTMGIQRWFYVDRLKKQVEASPKALKALIGQLTKLYKKLFTQKALMAHLTCEKPTQECLQLLLEHVNKYPEGKFVRIADYYRKHQKNPAEEVKMSRLFEVSSGPAFNALNIGLDELTEREKVAGQQLGDLLTNGYLWQTVRGANGAYAVSCNYDEQGKMLSFTSYRDPCIKKTFEAFLKALESEIDEDAVKQSIVLALCRQVRPQAPMSYSYMWFQLKQRGSNWKQHLERKKILRTLTKTDFEALARKILARSETQLVQVTVCGKEALQGQKPKVEFDQTVQLPI